MINLTPIARLAMGRYVDRAHSWTDKVEDIQQAVLRDLVKQGRKTRFGIQHVMSSVYDYEHFTRQIPVGDYEDFRDQIMMMVKGKADVLWPGVTRRFAQSSGTSGDKSKYIPVTDKSLQTNHYAGPRYAVAHYLRNYHQSRLFGGKAFILGGSFANELSLPPGVKVGDLSASLIDEMPPIAEKFRVPAKDVALMENWTEKLPALVEAALDEDITNISGVPSWFLTVLNNVIAKAGATTIHDVWPHLEVFFHGGISFAPYRQEYERITAPGKMRYVETYNASEGFFAVQDTVKSHAMLLLLDAGVFYEFIPLDQIDEQLPKAIPAWHVEEGAIYALVITACNGLWRYRIGDLVRIESVRPLRISVAGRTKSYINAFGEEVMVHNADAAIVMACKLAGCSVVDYTAGPVYAKEGAKGRHEWWIEWGKAPEDIDLFVRTLDKCLQAENSDYQAKRSGDIFLDEPIVHTAPAGLFDKWLAATGKLGGQRKVPRLCNDRRVLDALGRLAADL